MSMAEFSHNDPSMFADHINKALVGELPSFGIAKESKFQQLMQRNQAADPAAAQHANAQALTAAAQDQQNFKLDTSLSVEAKAFQPTTATQFAAPASVANTINSFEALDINDGMRHHSSTNMQPMANSATPNPVAREFVPRNMSAPNLNHSQQNGTYQSIPEFIPNRSMNRANGMPQQNQFIPPQGNQFSAQPMMPGHPDPGVPRMPNNTSSPMMEYLPGTHLPSPAPGQAIDPRLSSSSVFTSPQSHNTSSPFYAGDGSTPLTANSMGAFSTPGTSSPFPRQPLDSLSTSHVTPERTSPLLSRRLTSHRGSPSLGPVSTGVGMDMNAQQPYSETDQGLMQQHLIQENGGTTYFFTQKTVQQNMSVVMPSFNMFPGSPPHIEYMTLKANAPSFFMSNDLRQVIMKKHALTMLTVDTEQDPSIPAEVDNYHSLFPLEAVPENPLQKSNTYGFVTSCYKAIKYKDGLPYCLRRIHGFRQVTEKCMVLVEMWKKLQHANVVQLREVFTSKAFGEHSLIFAHDYHAGAETMMSRHFQNPNNNYASKAKWNGGTTRQNAGLLPESLIWTYVVQLTSALRCIHAAGLACRVMDPTKILITDKSRIRINGVGIFDVLGYDSSHSNPRAHMQQYQQDDMVALGKVVLALACNSVNSIQRDNLPKSIELVVMNYSNDLKNLILYLLSPQQRPHSVNDIMPMIGARFYMQLDAAMLRCDVIENELAKEMENGRLFRMLAKLGVVNERPEFGIEPTWSETGDRYLLKLFRDHLFHQVTETGAPWIDLAHIVQCLNKLDSGVPEKLCLMSRDEQNVLVVSYAELKKAFAKCFNELVNTSLRH
uniref:PAN2-PAN3 deadenylation complex subunit PAN3 n=1 Tax=Phallusia mammillata TaxID=59560 RepID=A0A6F9DMJ2_9ASCI|nr:PAB-dependent poly(A)-specific ribonuclease subunit PAN3-like [Phallusia mammillata]